MYKEKQIYTNFITFSLLSFSKKYKKEKPKPGTAKARDSKNQYDLDGAQRRAAKDSGFIKKIKTDYNNQERWRTMLEEWPLRSVCRMYATKNFVCKFGACGKLHEGCRSAHKPWTDLSADAQAKVRAWAEKYSDTFVIVES